MYHGSRHAARVSSPSLSPSLACVAVMGCRGPALALVGCRSSVSSGGGSGSVQW